MFNPVKWLQDWWNKRNQKDTSGRPTSTTKDKK